MEVKVRKNQLSILEENMLKTKILAVAAIVAMSSSVMAVELPTGNISLGLADSNSDQATTLGLQFDVSERLEVKAELRDYDDALNTKHVEYGLQYNHPLNSGLEAFASYSQISSENDAMDDDADVFALGLTASLGHGLELETGVERLDWDNSADPKTDFFFGVTAHIAKDVSVSLVNREALDQVAVKVNWAF
jgi:hypothetical protein